MTAATSGASTHLQPVMDTLSCLAEPYLLTDLDGEVLFANRAARRVFDTPEPPSSLVDVAADPDTLRQVLDRWSGSAAPRPATIALGDGRSLRGNGCRLRNHAAIIIRFSRSGDRLDGLAQLTTQVQQDNLRRRQDELERSLQHLHAANRRLDAFEDEMREHAGAVAHDVRTPLFTILGAARRLRAGGHVDEAGTPYLELLLDGATHLHDVTESLLGIARIDRAAWDTEPVSTIDVARAVVAEREQDLADIDAEVVMTDLPGIVADRRALHQVMYELIDNCISYRSAERPLRVEISGRRQDRWVEIRVDDNGRGIPPGPEDRLFELFQGGTRAAAAQGRGIGLATCRRLVTRWGGQIRCERRSTPGASFVFTARSNVSPERAGS